ALNGGGCGRGALAALATPLVSGSGWSKEAKFVVAVVAGGLVSKLTGGDFANGAATAAFAYLFAGSARDGDSASGGDSATGEGGRRWDGTGPPPAVAQAQNSLAVQLTRMVDAVGDFFGYVFKSDSVILGRNLTDAGDVRELDQRAHHMVAANAAAAAPARAV